MIELLASMAIFLLIIVVGATIVSSATGVSRTTRQQVEIRKEARQVFDRMALDFLSAVRFDTYQLQTSGTSTDSVLSLLSSIGHSGDVRLQRIDYRISTNGIFRSVRTVGWNDPQDLGTIQEGSAELLSPYVGNMVVQTLLSDGTTTNVTTVPNMRTNPRPVGVRVGLALVGSTMRKDRGLTTPVLNTTNGSPWVSITIEDERKGWRSSEKTFRLP